MSLMTPRSGEITFNCGTAIGREEGGGFTAMDFESLTFASILNIGAILEEFVAPRPWGERVTFFAAVSRFVKWSQCIGNGGMDGQTWKQRRG